MQRYYICRGRLGDDGRWRAMAAHFVPTSWFAQVFNYYFHLPWRKALAGVLVAGIHQLLLYRLASFYPRHEVVFSHARAAVREVHERKFLLGVCANLEILGHSFLLSKDYYLFFCLGINLSRDFGILRIIFCLWILGFRGLLFVFMSRDKSVPSIFQSFNSSILLSTTPQNPCSPQATDDAPEKAATAAVARTAVRPVRRGRETCGVGWTGGW